MLDWLFLRMAASTPLQLMPTPSCNVFVLPYQQSQDRPHQAVGSILLPETIQ